LPVKTQADFRLRTGPALNFALAVLAALTLAACQKNNPAAEAAAQADQVTVALNAANQQLANGHTGQAIAALQTLHAANPNRADVTENVALAEAHAGQLPQAAALFIEAANHDPSRRPLLIYAAALEATLGNHPAAIQQYQAYLAFFPNDAPALRALARELRALNQAQPALDAYLQSLKYTPGNLPSPTDALAIAQLFFQLDNTTQADTWFRETLQLQPDDDTTNQAQLGLLSLAVQQQNWPAAQKIITALDLTPAGTAALDASPLAATRDRLKQWNDAQLAVQREQAAAQADAAQRATQLASLANGNSTAATNSTATLTSNNTTPDNTDTPATEPLTSSTGNTTTASTTTSPPSALSNQPSSSPSVPSTTSAPSVPSLPPPDPLLAAAQQAQAEGRFPDAIRTYWKILAKDDSSPDTWLALAQSYNSLKQFSDAANTAQEAIRRAPTNPTYTLFYLQIIKTSQTPFAYQSACNTAYQQFPDSADLALTLADAFHQAGDNRDSTTVLNDYLHRHPTDPRSPDFQSALANLPAKAQ
jgi:tetratricopeptide (TPR) repeat protein